MNNYMAHAYQASREREWTNLPEIPAWIVPDARHRPGSHRFRRALAVLLIAATAAFGAICLDFGSTHPVPDCPGWSSVHQMSVRPSNLPRFRVIPGQPPLPMQCWPQPGDPVNQNFAIRTVLF